MTAFLVAGLATTPAFAGGLSEPMMQPAPTPIMAAPAPQPVSNWGGLYVGGQIGTFDSESSALVSDFLTADDLIDLDLDPSFLDETIDIGLNGTAFGLHIGYMYDIGNLVLGAELDYDQINFDELSGSIQGVTVSENVDGEDGTIARLKGRVGYNAGRFLPYATAGVARLDVDSEDTNGTFYGAGVAF